MKILGQHLIDASETEFGVRLDDSSFVLIASDEQDARGTSADVGGTVVARKVYTTPWADVEDK